MKPITFVTCEMEINNVTRRTTEETGKDYVVIKAWPGVAETSCFCSPRKRLRRSTTFVCFVEGLFPVLETEAVYSFHGDIEFSWGGTYLSITKLYDQEGNRILRKKGIKEKENHPESIEEKP